MGRGTVIVLLVLVAVAAYTQPSFAAPVVSTWEIAVTHAGTGEIFTAITDPYFEPRTAGISKLRVTLSEQLDPATVNSSSVTINALQGGDLSSLISNVTLDPNTVITIELSSSLPGGDSYSIRLADSIQSQAGEPISGSRTVGMTQLTGDVDNSGTVNLLDIIGIRNRMGGFDPAQPQYDIDGSGVIDETDLVLARANMDNSQEIPVYVSVSPYKAWIVNMPDTQQLIVSVHCTSGNVYDFTNPSTGTEYYIDNLNIATVTADGLITPVVDGEAIVAAKVFGLEDTCKVRVITAPAVATDESGWIDGIVYDATTDTPLQDAIITVEGQVGRVLSGPDGKFAFPTSGSGLFFTTIYKDGFTYHQRRIEVTRTLDSASYPAYLLPQAAPLQPLSTPSMMLSSTEGSETTPESGQMYTNNSGTIQMIFSTKSRFGQSPKSYSSSLSMAQSSSEEPQPPVITATQVTRSIELPDTLPEQSEFTYAFFFDVDGEDELPEPVTIRFANTRGFAPGTLIPVGRWNDKLLKWEHEAVAIVTPDGQWIEYQASRFSAHDINFPVSPPPQEDSPDPDDPENEPQSQPPNNPGPGECNGNGGSSFIMARSGQLFEDHALPVYRSLGQNRTTRLVYNSRAADPAAFIAYDLNQDPTTTITPAAHGFKVSIEGRQYEGWTQGTDGMRRHAFMWDGKNDRGNLLPTGCYFYYTTFTNEYQANFATSVNNRFGGPADVQLWIPAPERASYPSSQSATVSIINEQDSPLGAGWTVAGLQRLHIDPAQTRVVLVDGSGSAITFRTGLDVAIVDSSNVSIFLGNGDGTLQNRQSFTTGGIPGRIELGDFNGDGQQDVVTSNAYSSYISISLGNGDGTLQNAQSYTVGWHGGVAVGDFNRDGCQDLVVPDYGNNEIAVLIGNGDGTFQPDTRFSIGSSSYGVAVGDFNGDGQQDVVTANSGSDDVSVLLGNGDGTFQGQQRFAAGGHPNRVAVGDFNGDGRQDVVTVNWQSDDVSVLLGNGDGTFQNQQRFTAGDVPSAYDGPYDIAIGDFNGDGRQDVVTANEGSNNISVLLGNGDGTLQDQQKISVGSGPGGIKVADLNGDGLQDVVTANTDSRDISVLLGNGDGTFQGQQRFAAGGYPYDVAIGDFDKANGAFVSPPGDYSQLKRNPDQTYTRTMKDGTVHTFDSDGFQTQTVDRNGNTTTYEYIGSGMDKKIWKITDPAGLVTIYAYNGNVLMSIADPSGRTTQFEVNANNDLIKITNPDGTFRSFEYDSRHLLIAQTDASGMRTEYRYDSYGCVTEAIKAVGTPDEQHKYFQASVNQGLINDLPAGVGTRYNPAPVVRPEDIRESYTNGEGETELYYTNNFGFRSVIEDDLGRITRMERDEFNNVVQVTSPKGNQVSYEYDSKGNVTKITNHGVVPPAETLIEYDPTWNRPTRIEDPENHVTAMAYDPANGNLLTVTDAMNYQSTFTYNSKGQVETITNAENEAVQFVYYATTDPNGFGNLHQITVDQAGLNLVTTIKYDKYGNVKKTTDAESNITNYVYDLMNLLRYVTDAENQTTEYQYEEALGTISRWSTSPLARLTKIIDARSVEAVVYNYDSLHRLESKTNAIGKIQSYSYDNENRLVSTTDPKNQTISYTYDDAGRLITKMRPISGGTENVSYEYDLNSNLTRITDTDSDLTFGFDNADRLTSYSSAAIAGMPALSLSYTYHDDGVRDTMIGPSGTTSYTSNANHWLTQITDPASRITGSGYDQAGRRTSKINHNSTSVSYSYDNAARLTDIVHKLSSTPFMPLSYTHDNGGNILTMTDPDGTHNYSYDDIYQLAGATHPNPAENPNESYTFDATGNRMTSHVSGSHSHNNANQLLEDDDYTYTYDDNGNMETKTAKTGGAVTTYAYDSENRLIRVDMPSGTWAQYRYDALGRRTEKNVSGVITRYTYDGEDILCEYDGSNTIIARYTHGPGIDEPLIMERAGQPYYYHTDHLGSIRALTDSTGSTAHNYKYDSFGKIVAQTGTIANPYTYTAREYDEESGLYYYRNRTYAPGIGRFLQTDPIGHLGGINLYSYVSNNPHNWIDPYGLQEGCTDTTDPEPTPTPTPTPTPKPDPKPKQKPKDPRDLNGDGTYDGWDDAMWLIVRRLHDLITPPFMSNPIPGYGDDGPGSNDTKEVPRHPGGYI